MPQSYHTFFAIQNLDCLLQYWGINILSMGDDLDDRIIIEEPPLQKLTKKRSCFKKTCFNACGCLVVVLVGSLFFLRFLASPKEKNIRELPEFIKQSIPLYDEGQISKISLNPGQETQKRTELLTFFPKLIVSPFVVHFPHRLGDKGNYTSTSTKKEIFYGFMRQPIGETRDIYTLEWKNLTAEPNFIAEYYNTEMENKGFQIEYDQSNSGTRQILYSKKSVFVTLIIDDKNSKNHDTDKVTLTVSL